MNLQDLQDIDMNVIDKSNYIPAYLYGLFYLKILE